VADFYDYYDERVFSYFIDNPVNALAHPISLLCGKLYASLSTGVFA
jgi:hypothetical protein